MFGTTNNNNIHSSISPTSWHPIGNSPSYDLWELPHPASRIFDEEMRDQPDPSSASVIFDFEHPFLAPILSSWSSSSASFHLLPHDQQPLNPRGAVANRQRLDSQSSTNTSRTNPTTGNSPVKKQTLGDATNTAPVLRVSRSRFL